MSHNVYTPLPERPTNRIYTGVAGTGKTYQLLQLQKQYNEVLASQVETHEALLSQLIEQASWREVVCAVLLDEQRAMMVPEILQHPLLQQKAAIMGRENNVAHTLWSLLQRHTHPASTTVNHKKRAGNFFFDKGSDSSWYLLEDVKEQLQSELSDLLSLYDGSKSGVQSQGNLSRQNDMTLSRSSFVSFHQSYGYDEFVEGIRPKMDETTGHMRYEVQPGVFLKLCEKAAADPAHRYAMLIDEMNRANVAQVFGELMSLVEPDKRVGQPQALKVRLAYSGRLFGVPENVDIYASMNTQDHSLIPLDMAFRRRFEFVELQPTAEGLPDIEDETGQRMSLSALMQGMNARIAQYVGTQALLGQAFFYGVENMAQLRQRFVQQILPQLMTSCANHPNALEDILKLKTQPKSQQWLWQSAVVTGGGFGGVSYQINPDALSGNTGKLPPEDAERIGYFFTAAAYERLL